MSGGVEATGATPVAAGGPSLAIVILAVERLDRAVAFYRGAFGLRPRIEAPVFVELELPGGGGLGLYERAGFARNTGAEPGRPGPGQTTSTELYFHVEDLPAACARLARSGARLLSPASLRPWGEEAAYFGDLDGNVVVVAARAPR